MRTGVLIATPVLIILLSVSLVGGGLALLLGPAYVLLIFLSYIYAGILVGGALRYSATKRSPTLISWRNALAGMLLFFIVGNIPYLGGAITFIAVCLILGFIVSGLYAFGFRPDTSWQE
jgi:hypothetical protein